MTGQTAPPATTTETAPRRVGGDLSDLAVGVVGPGRVGTSLAAWLVAGGARITGVFGRGEVPSLETADADLLLLAVPDPALEEVAAALAHRPQAGVALHVSGSRGAEVLSPLREGATVSAIGTLHPLKAFPRPLPDPREAHGVFFAVDGDRPAVALARRLAESFGGVAGQVPRELRPLYHFAATLAAGGVTTLLTLAAEQGERLGLPPDEETALARGYLALARGALAGAERALDDPESDPGEGTAVERLAGAITGPLARGDLDTHVAGLARVEPDRVRQLAVRLGDETIRLVGGLGIP
jgi:predicted short-subunit dehydrogenase-like oxidoreductase (DUF2520 family)